MLEGEPKKEDEPRIYTAGKSPDAKELILEKEKEPENTEQEISPEFLETLEKTPFSPEDKVWILLTKAGLKPASWVDFVARNEENNGKVNKKLSDEEVNLAISFLKDNFFCSQNHKIRKIISSETSEEIGEEENISFVISNTQENFERLSEAINIGDEKGIGLALGFEPTAVNAYCGNGKLMDNEKLEDEILFSEAFAFAPSRLSADHWQEELEQYQKWADYVKKTSPNLFNKMMGFHS